MKNVLKLAILSLFMCSCSSSIYKFRSKSSDYLDINKGKIQQVSKTAEYRVDTSKKATGKYAGEFNKMTMKSDIELAKQLAIADAITKSKCDFLINPLYDIKINGMNIEVVVEGYSAFYTKFTTEGAKKDSNEIIEEK